ncbi:clumping factor A-like [Neoarius graeffei]|uniref:clumping factor A-like n=1 Tax=Neoarius graeffei TaxID=443677 RepID=UPI00298C4165|nr:clumping factor A-like [Neoarius graeffei]
MKICIKMEMLATMVALFLALGVSNGLVIGKCRLGSELNSTLPADLLDKFTNLVSQIVCHAELSSDFNTSTVTQITGPNICSFFKSRHCRRKSRSAESSSEESSEEDIDSSSGAQRPRRSAEDSSNDYSSEGDTDSSSGARRPRRSAEDSSNDYSSEGDTDSSSGARRPRRSAEDSSNDYSSEEDTDTTYRPPYHKRPDEDSSIDYSSEIDVNITYRPQRQRRSVENSSSKKCNKGNLWTLYGLFQLPDRIFCTSGLEPSLNLCRIPCDNLIDDDIRDDIICVETLLNKTLAARKKRGPLKAFFKKLYNGFFQKECAYVNDFEYFSTCF